MESRTMLPSFGNYCDACGNESRIPSRTCGFCGALARGRTPHYWEESKKLYSRKQMIQIVTNTIASFAELHNDPQYMDWGNGDPSVPGNVGFHDCGDGTVELMGWDPYSTSMEEGTYYCTVDVAWDVCLALQMDLLPTSITGKLKGRFVP